MARQLLGTVLVSTIGGVRCTGMIVETEAYGGPEDPASHAATRSGVTERNRAMFGAPGCAYIYRSYGVHWCLNVVTGPRGRAEAVLIRGLQPLSGVEHMMERRGGVLPTAAGPGRLCQALGVDRTQYEHDLSKAPLRLVAGWRVGDEQVRQTPRVGITKAADRLLRFYVVGAEGVTPRGSTTRR